MPLPSMASTRGDFDEGDLLRTIASNVARPQRILRRLGFLVATRGKAAFASQRRGPFVWRERAVPNVPGILSDLREGRSPPERRFRARPALMDRGRLLADLGSESAVTPEGTHAVRIGSRLPYAALHQHGGEVDIPIDDDLKGKIRALLERASGRARRAEREAFGDGPKSGDFEKFGRALGRAGMLQAALGPLLRKRVTGITWRIPARPFVVVDAKDREDLGRMAAALLMGGS